MRLTPSWRLAGVFLLVAALAAGGASAQNLGNIFGVVSDETDSTLPGVTVTLEGMGAPRVTVTDANGNYRFPGLDPGTYYLKSELDGKDKGGRSKIVGAAIARRCLDLKIERVIFDRGGYLYTGGCVRSLADAAREAGLKF